MPSAEIQRSVLILAAHFRITWSGSAGTQIGYYFAWLRFYTIALMYLALVGTFVWWREGMSAQGSGDGLGIPGGSFGSRNGVLL